MHVCANAHVLGCHSKDNLLVTSLEAHSGNRISQKECKDEGQRTRRTGARWRAGPPPRYQTQSRSPLRPRLPMQPAVEDKTIQIATHNQKLPPSHTDVLAIQQHDFEGSLHAGEPVIKPLRRSPRLALQQRVAVRIQERPTHPTLVVAEVCGCAPCTCTWLLASENPQPL